MNKGFYIIKKENTPVSKWFGGEIYRYFVYPKTSSYDDKDFTLALVGAAVNLDESDFTDYSGYGRIIMTIDNDLTLNHNGGEMISLDKHELYAYDGGDTTKSYGKADDFNIIFKKGQAFGDARNIEMVKDTKIDKNIVVVPGKDVFEFVFCIEGSFIFSIGEENTVINAEDLIVIDHSLIKENYTYKADDRAKIILGTFICEKQEDLIVFEESGREELPTIHC